MFNRFLTILITFTFVFGLTGEAWADTKTNKKTDFIEIQQVIPSVILDMKYATKDNFTHTKLYDSSQGILRRGTADKLNKVAAEVAQKGLRLKVWDAYRDPQVQFKMWKLVPDSRYVANPYKGFSNHSRGSALDLSLTDIAGNEIKMPTEFDNFTTAAARVNENDNARYLEKIMVKYGFKPLATEWWHFDDSDNYDPVEYAAVMDSLQPEIGRVELTLSAIGDVTLGQDEKFQYAGSFDHYYKQKGAGYFFSGVKRILSEDDLTIANLEGTLTKATQKPNKSFQGNRAFFFKGSPAYTAILIDGSIEAVNLANNHSMDDLEEGYRETVSALDKTGIKSFSDGKVTIFNKNGLKIGLIGINALGKIEEGVNFINLEFDLANKIRLLQNQTNLIIVSCHWGKENVSTPTAEQRELGRLAVDQGASLVLGHHPHVLQPIEVYKGKTIVYSLGNFVFGGNSNPTYKATEIFQQTFWFENGQLTEIDKPFVIPCKLSGSFRPQPLAKSANK